MTNVLSFSRDREPLSSRLDRLIADAGRRLYGVQQGDGHWVFELEADATIPSEYIMLRHYLGDIDRDKEAKLADYIRRLQSEVHGGWPLFHDGDFNISASVKAYYALKLAGDDPDAPHMRRAREAILNQGGAETANVFTRTFLALFGQVPWTGAPVMPVEIMLLPKWFPFHISKIAYWSRTVVVPLLILTAYKKPAANPDGVHIRELFTVPPEQVKRYQVNPTGEWIGEVFLWLDRVLQWVEPFFPKRGRRRAVQRAVDFITPRLNGEDGLGAIYPAMANAVMAFHVMGYAKDHPDFVAAFDAVEKLTTVREDGTTYVQPCVSPIWDTCLAAHAIQDVALATGEDNRDQLVSALDWLAERQILDVVGDWAWQRPDVRPGGWAFQYANDYYPDVDDTAVVVMAMHRADPERYRMNIDRATEWVLGVQSDNGGWGAFDANNTHTYLNSIPFADHGALLDPPTEDVTARCLSMLCQLGYAPEHPAVAKAVRFLLDTQQEDGSWFGRWGANYVYGTWSVLCALNAAGLAHDHPAITRAVAWLEYKQRQDGGWGEDLASYEHAKKHECKSSVPSQTAWAVLGLMAVGRADSSTVQRGIEYLEAHPRDGARWDEAFWTGTGFPRVFYLKYHGYAAYFPLWAVSRYRALLTQNDRTVPYGM